MTIRDISGVSRHYRPVGRVTFRDNFGGLPRQASKNNDVIWARSLTMGLCGSSFLPKNDYPEPNALSEHAQSERSWLESRDHKCTLLVNGYTKQLIPPVIWKMIYDFYFESIAKAELDEFDLLRVGGGFPLSYRFHKRIAVRKKDSGKEYSMLIFKKKDLIAKHREGLEEMERKIIQSVQHPFQSHVRFVVV